MRDYPCVLDVAASPTEPIVVVTAANRSYHTREGGKGVLESWSLQTGKRLQVFTIESKSCTQINTVVFNHNGAMLITGGGDGMIRVFDMMTCTPIMVWQAHSAQLTCLRLSSDETTVMSFGLDGIINEWNVHRVGTVVRSFKFPFSSSSSSSSSSSVSSTSLRPEFNISGPYFILSDVIAHAPHIDNGTRCDVGLYSIHDLLPKQFLCGHTGNVMSVDWNANKLVMGSSDHTLRLISLVPRSAGQSAAPSTSSSVFVSSFRSFEGTLTRKKLPKAT